MKLIIDISKGRYDEIMSMDWNNCRLLFDEEIRAIHDGKALEQEPCADMVSRDAMWDVLQRLYGTEGELVEELMSLPPVLPMPKMGKWIYKKKEDSYRCSLCTFPCHKDNLGAIPTKYCAGCGAVMEVQNAVSD